jgi:hypothetical protein
MHRIRFSNRKLRCCGRSRMQDPSANQSLPRLGCLWGTFSPSRCTLRSAFRHELDVGHVKANSAVAESLYQQAIKGNVTAAIWWTKARTGWKETTVQHFQDADGNPIGPTLNLSPRRPGPLMLIG